MYVNVTVLQGLHLYTVRRVVSTFVEFAGWVHGVSVTKPAQVEPRNGRVKAPGRGVATGRRAQAQRSCLARELRDILIKIEKKQKGKVVFYRQY